MEVGTRAENEGRRGTAITATATVTAIAVRAHMTMGAGTRSKTAAASSGAFGQTRSRLMTSDRRSDGHNGRISGVSVKRHGNARKRALHSENG